MFGKQSKIWGNTRCIFKSHSSEAHFLEIKAGSYCSEHLHLNKWNRFFIVSGSLHIKIFKEDGIIDETILYEGDFTDVPPGVYHQFEAHGDCQCIEIYWIDDLDINDIQRRTVGGIL